MRKHSLNPPAVAAVTVILGLGFAVPRTVRGQEAQATLSQITVNGVTITGLPEDWTHHHSYFSNPGTEEEAIARGKHDEWLKIVNEPRYIIQQLHRHGPVQGQHAAEVVALETPPEGPGQDPAALAEPEKRKGPHKDWSEAVGTGDFAAENFPAKWSFSYTTASCSDFVVYATGSTGSSTTATIIAYSNLYGTSNSTGCGANPGGAVPQVNWAYNTGAYQIGNAPIFSANGQQIAFMQYYCTVSGSTCSSYGTQLVLLKWKASTSDSFGSPDTNLTTVSNSAYPTCTAPCMTTLIPSSSDNDLGWSNPYYDYTTDSLWVGGNGGLLHKFSPVFNGTPAEITSAAGWPVTLNTSYQSTSPVFDPNSGCVFVGNIRGYLYRVNSGNGSTDGHGHTYTTCTSTSGSIAATSTAYCSCSPDNGIIDGPLLDSTAESVYAFSEDYNTSGYHDVALQFAATFTGSAATASKVALIGYGPAGYGNGSKQECEGAADGIGVMAGTFDNIYLNSSSGTLPSGHIYVVGNTEYPTALYQLAVSSNVLSTTVTTVATITGNDEYLGGYYAPLTEFCNNAGSACGTNGTITTPGTDYLYVSTFWGAASACGTQSSSTGCVMVYNVTNPSSISAGTSAMNIPAGGDPTSGIIVDNSSSFSGASQIYFLTDDSSATACTPSGPTGICAVQASQTAP